MFWRPTDKFGKGPADGIHIDRVRVKVSSCTELPNCCQQRRFQPYLHRACAQPTQFTCGGILALCDRFGGCLLVQMCAIHTRRRPWGHTPSQNIAVPAGT